MYISFKINEYIFFQIISHLKEVTLAPKVKKKDHVYERPLGLALQGNLYRVLGNVSHEYYILLVIQLPQAPTITLLHGKPTDFIIMFPNF
jgi:hypothetical protein